MKRYLAMVSALIISMLLLSPLSHGYTTYSSVDNITEQIILEYPGLKEKIDILFEKLEDKVSIYEEGKQIETYDNLQKSIVRYQQRYPQDSYPKISAILSYMDRLSGIAIYNIQNKIEVPKIIPGIISPEERGASELGEFSISGGSVTLSELELNIIGNQIFSILKGKVYILDSDLKKIAENTKHSYYNKASTVTFKTQEIQLNPGKYTIWVESIEAEEDTNIEIKINDMEVVEEQLGDDFEDLYIGTIISKTQILHINQGSETPKIIPGIIAPEERGVNEIGEFTISGANLNIRELELKIIGDKGFSIIEGKIYILDSSQKTIAEKSGYRYSNRSASVSFNSEKITLIPGKYTLWVEKVMVEEDTNIEIEIEDMKAVEDGIEDTYIGTTISETEILYVEE